jgi:hypothetical protein
VTLFKFQVRSLSKSDLPMNRMKQPFCTLWHSSYTNCQSNAFPCHLFWLYPYKLLLCSPRQFSVNANIFCPILRVRSNQHTTTIWTSLLGTVHKLQSDVSSTCIEHKALFFFFSISHMPVIFCKWWEITSLGISKLFKNSRDPSALTDSEALFRNVGNTDPATQHHIPEHLNP